MKKSIAIAAIVAMASTPVFAEEARGNNSFMGDGSSRMESDTKGQATFSMSFTGTVDQATQLFGRGSTQNLTNTKAEVEDDK